MIYKLFKSINKHLLFCYILQSSVWDPANKITNEEGHQHLLSGPCKLDTVLDTYKYYIITSSALQTPLYCNQRELYKIKKCSWNPFLKNTESFPIALKDSGSQPSATSVSLQSHCWFSGPSTCHTHSNHRAFSQTVSCVWGILPCCPYVVHSCFHFRSKLQWHIVRKTVRKYNSHKYAKSITVSQRTVNVVFIAFAIL